METCLESSHEDEELGEEAGERRDTCQGEQAKRHEERELGVGLVESVVVVDANLAGVLLNRGHHNEGAEVGGHVDEEVEHEGGHALRRAVHHAENEVTSLRNGGESHKALEVLLANGEEVGDGDRGDDDPEEPHVPRLNEGAGAEGFHQHGHQHEGGRAFGDDAEITRHHGRRAFIGVGCPEVEGNERYLEAHARDEEHEAEDAQHAVARKQCADFAEIERARGSVDERHAIEEQCAGEEGEQDELRAGLGTLEAALVERHECRHGHGGEFKADEEHEEVAAGNHQIHAEERKKREEVELSLLHEVLFAAEPFVRHEEHDDGAHVENALHEGHHRRVLVHAAECGGFGRFAAGQQVEEGVRREQHDGEAGVERAAPALFVGTHDEVGNKKYGDNCQQRQFFVHN